MSELMTPISFRQLMTWIVAEHDREGSVFGVHRPFHPSGKTLPIFGEIIGKETFIYFNFIKQNIF